MRGLGRSTALLSVTLAGASLTACASTPTTRTTVTTIAAGSIRSLPVGVGSPPLTATLTLPSGSGPFPAVVLVSGSGPNDQDETVGSDKPFLDIADGLAQHGIASLRYDKRTKDYPEDIDLTTFTATEEFVPDALAAINLLRSRSDIDSSRVYVLGHSEGGTFAPLIARDDPSVAGVIMLAAAAEPLGAALLRQVTYLATLPGSIGAQADAGLPSVQQAAQQVASCSQLAAESPTTKLSPVWGGAGPAYFLDLCHYDEVATALAIPQPLLFLQGGRDYQVTVANDLDVWTKELSGRRGVTVQTFPNDDHLFIKGSGPPSPGDYDYPRHVDPQVISAIVAWIHA